VLPAVIAPLVLAELDADPAWVGVYYGLAAAASLVEQMGCGSFIRVPSRRFRLLDFERPSRRF
jgi:hypothetical protein